MPPILKQDHNLLSATAALLVSKGSEFTQAAAHRNWLALTNSMTTATQTQEGKINNPSVIPIIGAMWAFNMLWVPRALENIN